MKARVNGNADLTVDQVRMIRHRIDSGEATAPQIARELRMSAEAIRRVGRRETWAWVQDAAPISEVALQGAVEHSQERFLRLLSGEEQAQEVSTSSIAVTEESRSAAEKMAEAMMEERQRKAEKALKGDKYLGELTGGQDGTADRDKRD